MACRGPTDAEYISILSDENKKLRETNDKVTQLLCALTTTVEAEGDLFHFLELTDWKESGTTRVEFEAWWKNHKIEDAARRERERVAKELQIERKIKEAKRTAALEKLTEEERKLLGVK